MRGLSFLLGGAIVLPLLATAVAATSCSSSSTDPGPEPDSGPGLDRQALLDPETCKTCHVNHYNQWAGSMHAYASEDPVFRAMNARGQRETKGELGDFCVKCHAPMAVRENATKDGLNLDSVPAALKGVTCYFCHSVDKIEGQHNGQLGVANDLVLRGAFADPVKNTAHRSAYSPMQDGEHIESANMCGSCHDIETGHGAKIERTFLEWKESIFSRVPGGRTCGQCHMSQSARLEPIAQAPGVFARRTHDHTMPGVDVALTPFPSIDVQRQRVQSFLDESLQSALCVSQAGSATSIRVILDNVGAGHGIPSGSAQDRRLWMEVIAYSGANIVFKSGVVNDGVAAAIKKADDPDMWLMRDCMFDKSNKEVHMFWEAAEYEGNALPAKVTIDPTDKRFYQSHVIRKYPYNGGGIRPIADKVTLRVRLRPMDHDVLGDLVTSGDLDKAIADKMPTFDIGGTLTWTLQTANENFLENGQPYRCVTANNLNLKSDTVPAPERKRCSP